MTVRHYIGLIEKDAGTDFGVSFPDLPGCITAGTTLEEARAFAAEALALHLAGLAEDCEPAPEPSTLDAIMDDPRNRTSVAVLVAVLPAVAKTVRVEIAVPEDVLGAIDGHAERQGMDRAGFLVEAAKREMERVDASER